MAEIKPERFFIKLRGRITGPYERSRLRAMYNAGLLTPDSQVSPDKEHWLTLLELAAGEIPSPVPAAKPPPQLKPLTPQVRQEPPPGLENFYDRKLRNTEPVYDENDYPELTEEPEPSGWLTAENDALFPAEMILAGLWHPAAAWLRIQPRTGMALTASFLYLDIIFLLAGAVRNLIILRRPFGLVPILTALVQPAVLLAAVTLLLALFSALRGFVREFGQDKAPLIILCWLLTGTFQATMTALWPAPGNTMTQPAAAALLCSGCWFAGRLAVLLEGPGRRALKLPRLTAAAAAAILGAVAFLSALFILKNF